MKLTPYEDVNEILDILREGLMDILGNSLVGLYLTGSLSYGDFDRGSSDIDFLAVLMGPLSEDQLREIEKLHSKIGKEYPEWQKRIEGSYITQEMLSGTKPPTQSRPYVNAGKIWHFVYGYEWILNLHSLYESGITLFGPDPKDIISPIKIEDVRVASQKNLLNEWQTKLEDPTPFKSDDYNSSHLQAYAVLTMCRILYTANNKDVVSKKVAATWTKNTYGKQWRSLIEKAENWKHGKKLNLEGEIKKFIKFVVKEIASKGDAFQKQ